MIKKYAIQMSYEITDAEKLQADKALSYFNFALRILDLFSNHLNIIKTPFKDNPEISPEDIMNARKDIRNFRDKSLDKLNHFKRIAFKCVNNMQMFSTDTQVVKIMKSFISSIGDLQDKFHSFIKLFKDLQDKEFAKKIVESCEGLQTQCKNIDEIVEDRVIDHIKSNIKAQTWVDSIGQELQEKIEKKTPLIIDLFNKRQDQLNDAIKERTNLGV